MPSNLHLFSTPGERDIRHIVDACRPYCESKEDPMIAFLPLAFLDGEKWLDYTKKQFKGLARIEIINTERMTQKEIEGILRECVVAYISGGNTFLLNHRLHASGVMPFLKKKVQAGLPIVGFSAGAILCGPNILTSHDMNSVQTTSFNGLNVTPFNFFAHYSTDGYVQSMQDDWLSDYHLFQENPVILMCDNAYIKCEKGKTILVRGEAYILRKGQEKERLEEGQSIGL
ncbi:MAG TPA: Type 1 glutamine amidotransferase-like domain-containing protein [Anaerolineales bacterium]|nr:Type 1 glutamine amidotransferase-like domain-containing protein [Anaerolineales bacterium]